MTRRLDKTLADYIGIAISPVLIMLLVGSLVFFLLEVFYQGQYPERLHWVFFWFTIAIVLVGRISIEEGKERAQLFAAPLAVVTVLAMARLAELSVVGVGLIGLVWWCAHKLTWDCTMIDETEDASGEGLMQTIGLDEKAAHAAPPEPPPSDKPEEPEGVTSRDAKPPTWWERFVERQRRPHAPGVWVVYFSLAALPLFGIGQLFIPAEDAARRQYAFFLLLVYVASGLGLLLLTSFLGLRRYLRQRHLQMPPAMAGLWLTIGCVLIVALLLGSALLPRPGAEVEIAELPFSVGSRDRQSSRYAMMTSDPAKEDQGGPRSGASEDDQAGKPGSTGDEPGSPGGSKSEQEEAGPGSKADDSGSGAGPKGKQGESSSGPESDSEAEQQPDAASSQEDERGSRSKPDGDQQDAPPESDAGERSRDAKREEGDRGKPSESEAQKERGASRSEKADEQRQPDSERSGRGAWRERDRRSEKTEQTKSRTEDDRGPAGQRDQRSWLDPQAMTQGLGRWLPTLMKWILIGVLACVIGYWLWRSRAEVLGALRDFLAGWREFWQRLLGRGRGPVDQAALPEGGPQGPRPRSFAEFPDPFATGIADRYSPDELVQYSFDALEAWARDHGWGRSPEQTPHEFAQEIGTRVHSLSQDVRRLADLYCRVAYAPGTLPQKSVTPLKQLWRELRHREPVSV